MQLFDSEMQGRALLTNFCLLVRGPESTILERVQTLILGGNMFRIFLLVISALWTATAFAQFQSGQDYRIVSTCGAGTSVLAIQGSSTANGASLVIANRDASSTGQIFRLNTVSGNLLSVISRVSGKSLDVNNWSRENGAPIIQWDYFSNPNQQFRMISNADGTFSFQAVHSARYIDLPHGNTTPGTRLIQYDATGLCNQKYRLELVSARLPASDSLQFASNIVSGQSYRMITTCSNSNRVLSIQNGRTDNGAIAVVADRNLSSTAQLFRFDLISGNIYRLTSRSSGKVLDINVASQNDGAQVIQWDNYGTTNQQFRAIRNSDGTLSLQALHSSKFVDLRSSDSSIGNIFHQWTGNGTCAQKFHLEAQSSTTGSSGDQSAPVATSPAPTPTPIVTAPVSSTSPLVETVISDMTLPNDAQPNSAIGRSAGVQMGLMGRGDYTPFYWQPRNQALKSTAWWTNIGPWWNVFPFVGNQARHTRIEIGAIVTYVQDRSTRAWRRLDRGYSVWAGNYNAAASIYYGEANGIPGSFPGAVAYLPPAGTDTLHGGSGMFRLNPEQTSGILVCLAARLVVNSQTGIDDRSLAQYGMWVGADWNPWDGFNVGRDVSELGWVPAVGTSRLKRITNSWQAFCMAPFDNPGRNDGDPNSAGTTMSIIQYRQNPAPLTLQDVVPQ